MEGATSSSLAEKRITVVTGGNKGIGLEICRQLALNGIKVILTARDEKRGMEAVEKLRESGLSDVVFHQLDVTDPSSIASLADFIGVQFGKLDILVNNAGIGGFTIDFENIPEILKASNDEKLEDTDAIRNWVRENLQQTYELAEECLKTNYHGIKGVTEALLHHLQSSYSGTIVNVSSSQGKLKHIPNESLRQELNNIDGLSEDRLAELSNLFLKDFKEGLLGANNWPTSVSAYKVSKVLVNCYTRILAKRYPGLCINCICPGFVKTDINFNIGILTTAEGAKGPVMLALLPKGSSSGLFFDQTKISTFCDREQERETYSIHCFRPSFSSASAMEGATSGSLAEKRIAVVTGGNKGIGLEICRQLALNGVKVILTARDEKRGMEAVEKLRESGLSDVVFHQLDVTGPSSIASLADFIGVQFGKLDILVNNAAIGGYTIDFENIPEILKASNNEKLEDTDAIRNWVRENLQQTYEMAEECLKTNYHGIKGVTEALLHHLQSSYSGTIVNVSSSHGKLKHIPNESLRQELNDIDGLSEDRLADLSNLFLKEFKEGLLGANNWPTSVSAYKVSKVLVNCYTRILAKRHPSLCINCICPGFVKTDINFNIGILTTEEGAKGPVMLALLPKGSSSGRFFDQTKISTF
ncbi:uncharacterized protein LOC103712117 [Phoenix dactylifera]|uniref:Uncharacterized protein LOC103712117 n=1 Tax=Phoenix dactylifera TaxID=42345 RepID=A0A8B8ZZZ8_PHODC|nr:uncharacterized protein LOC103712117 [Phoenix dactylifera]